MKRARDEGNALYEELTDFTSNFFKDCLDAMPTLDNPPRLMVEEAVEDGCYYDTFISCLKEDHELTIENSEFPKLFTEALIDSYLAHVKMAPYQSFIHKEMADQNSTATTRLVEMLDHALDEHRLLLASALTQRFKESFAEVESDAEDDVDESDDSLEDEEEEEESESEDDSE